MLSDAEQKEKAGRLAAEYVKDGMKIGLGTGSTAYFAIAAIGKKVRAGLSIQAVPTSTETKRLCEEWKIPLTTLNHVDRLDLTIDGADEIDPDGNLIKGGGGALLEEKMVAAASRELIIVAHAAKQVSQLGSFLLPVEVIEMGYQQVAARMREQWQVLPVLRTRKNEPFHTDLGHCILDAPFGKIDDPVMLNEALHLLPGVVETGLFCGFCTRTILVNSEGEMIGRSFQRTALI